MAIDHGLGGKDGRKSKERREKRAKKTKTIALRAMTGGKKKEVIFDDKARTEWLSGFGKRKQERRKYGLAMEVLKKQKAHKEMMKDTRNAFKQTPQQVTISELDTDDIDVVPEKKQLEVSIYEDPSTLSMFGSTVSVVVDNSIGDEEENDIDDNASVRSSYSRSSNNLHHQRKEPTKLEKALKKAKSQMNNKKKHKDNSAHGRANSRALKKKVESSKLLSKALGKPMKGKNGGKRLK